MCKRRRESAETTEQKISTLKSETIKSFFLIFKIPFNRAAEAKKDEPLRCDSAIECNEIQSVLQPAAVGNEFLEVT
jgi:hypothetical protein